jgi:hypothetical protein
VLERSGRYSTRRVGTMPIDGPILFIERTPAHVAIRVLRENELGAEIPTGDAGVLSPEATRALLMSHATSRGLTASEADALVDAWAPAFFDRCHRTGPEASGRPPESLAQVDRSLLYFAPATFVDEALPLTITPVPRAVTRVFLVRYVDPATATVLASGPIGSWMDEPGMSGNLRSGREPPPPLVTLRAPVVVDGDLEPDVVRRFLNRNIMQARYCYELLLQRDPSRVGTVVLRASRAADGRVTNSTVSGGTITDESTRQCLLAMLRRVVLPEPESPSSSTFEVTYQFALP